MNSVRIIAKYKGVTVFDGYIPNYYDVAFWEKANYGHYDEVHTWEVPFQVKKEVCKDGGVEKMPVLRR